MEQAKENVNPADNRKHTPRSGIFFCACCSLHCLFTCRISRTILKAQIMKCNPIAFSQSYTNKINIQANCVCSIDHEALMKSGAQPFCASDLGPTVTVHASHPPSSPESTPNAPHGGWYAACTVSTLLATQLHSSGGSVHRSASMLNFTCPLRSTFMSLKLRASCIHAPFSSFLSSMMTCHCMFTFSGSPSSCLSLWLASLPLSCFFRELVFHCPTELLSHKATVQAPTPARHTSVSNTCLSRASDALFLFAALSTPGPTQSLHVLLQIWPTFQLSSSALLWFNYALLRISSTLLRYLLVICVNHLGQILHSILSRRFAENLGACVTDVDGRWGCGDAHLLCFHLLWQP